MFELLHAQGKLTKSGLRLACTHVCSPGLSFVYISDLSFTADCSAANLISPINASLQIDFVYIFNLSVQPT